MLHTPLAKLSTILAAAILAWALAAGRWPERLAAAAIGVDWTLGIFLQDHRRHHHGQPAIFLLDVLQAAVLLGLVAGSRRRWVLWGAALASLLVLTHVVALLNPAFGQWSYLTVTYVWSLGLLVALGAGVAFEGRHPAGMAPWGAWSKGLTAARRSTPNATARRRS